MEELTQEFYAVSSKIYQAAGAQGQPGAEGFDPNNMGGANQEPHDDNVVDADFKVDEDK